MRTESIFTSACLIGGLLFAACGAEPGKATEETTEQMQENSKEMSKADDAEEWREERAEAAKELRDLRENLVDKQTREQKRLADGIKDATKKSECEARITELKANIGRVDAALAKVDGSTDTDWSNTKAEARKTVDDTQNWIQREGEKIDWKTDADADNDGH